MILPSSIDIHTIEANFGGDMLTLNPCIITVPPYTSNSQLLSTVHAKVNILTEHYGTIIIYQIRSMD